MKQIPMIFQGWGVLAIIPGTKTMTRRFTFKGQPGDQIWVKETWRVGAWEHDGQLIAVDYKAGRYARREWLECPDETVFLRLVEQSQEDAEIAGIGFNRETGEVRWPAGEGPTRWRSSLFMPRWTSRLTLEVVSVRAERVQDISEEDAKAEGVGDGDQCGMLRYQEYFRLLWDSINAKRGFGWDANPLVQVIEFRRLT